MLVADSSMSWLISQVVLLKIDLLEISLQMDLTSLGEAVSQCWQEMHQFLANPGH